VIIFVCEGGYPKKPDSTDEELYEISKSIINLDPEKRLSLDVIKTILEKINFETPETIFTDYYKVQKDQYEKAPSQVKIGKQKEKENLNEYEMGPSTSEMFTSKIAVEKDIDSSYLKTEPSKKGK